MKECPNCGADVPPNAKACPECGSDENTGWSDISYAADLDLPLSDQEFNYKKYVEREFGTKKQKINGLPWYWWVAGVILLLALLSWLVPH